MIFFLPLVNIAYLLLNIFSSEVQSLCTSDGCSATVSLISITQSEMYFLGILALVVLICLYKYKTLYLMFLHILIVCETIFLSYLYFKSGSICLSCFVFYGLLIINYVVISLKEKKNLLGLFYIVAIVISFFVLDINKEMTINNGHTLITSESCVYCKEIKEKLKTDYKEVNYKNVKDIFKAFNLTTVPVYIIKEKNDIQIIEGKDNILREVGGNNFIFENPFENNIGCNVKKTEEKCD